jgi:sortase A
MKMRSALWFQALLKTGIVGMFTVGALFVSKSTWIHVKADAAQFLIDAAWHRERASLSSTAAPWPWADTRPIAKLTWGEGKAAPTLVVLEGSSGRNLAFGPVHDPASVEPGEVGNSVIEGHRDTHFKFLGSAVSGDHFSIETVDGGVKRYVVTDVRVVDSRRARILLNADIARITLVTCYPFDAVSPGGTLRWVVTAEETSSFFLTRRQPQPASAVDSDLSEIVQSERLHSSAPTARQLPTITAY